MSDQKDVYAVGDAASKALFAAGQKSVNPNERVLCYQSVGAETVAVVIGENGVPKHDSLITTAVRKSLLAPRAFREVVQLARIADLVAYVKRFQRAGTALFTAAPMKGRNGFAAAVIDYSENSDMPAWGRHRATVQLTLSRDVGKWLDVAHTQSELAALLDDYAPFVRGKVTAAELIDVADSLEVTELTVTGATRNKSTRMFDVQLRGTTTVTVPIPPSFTLELPLLENRPPIELDVKLELRKYGESHKFVTTIRRFDRLLADEFDKVNAELTALAGCPLFQVSGAPPDEMPVS